MYQVQRYHRNFDMWLKEHSTNDLEEAKTLFSILTHTQPDVRFRLVRTEAVIDDSGN